MGPGIAAFIRGDSVKRHSVAMEVYAFLYITSVLLKVAANDHGNDYGN
jgi:hypothetical protein